jgi:hypothetical protein
MKGKGIMTDHLPMREHVPVGHGIVGALLRLPLALLTQVLWVLPYPEVTAKYTRRSGSKDLVFLGLVILLCQETNRYPIFLMV